MTDFKRHKGQGLKITDAWVRPDTSDNDSDRTLADKIVLDTEKHGEVTHKPRDTETEEKMVDGMKTREPKEVKYAIKQLPEDIQALVKKAQEEDITVTADLGEAIQENGDSSYYIPKGSFDSIQQQDTIFQNNDEGDE